ncbi:MAG: EVE domain-containing protein [Chloroflexi bacterium]|nr:EVE domain-containing protein [Chloroflexota bacterium]
MSPIPDTSRDALLEAMARFDREERGTPRWQTWEQGRFGAHRFAITHDGRLYPVKRIVALASGAASRDFLGGDEANAYVQQYGFRVKTLNPGDEAPGQAEDAIAVQPAWIFQGDPNQFDIEAAVRELPQIYWGVRQHADKIRAGDRVYFWISGPDAGIVAVGTILADPGDRESAEAEQRFYRDTDRFQGTHRQVPVRIDDVLPERIRRTELREHPVLRDLTILQLAQGTNFIVRPDQAAALQALIVDRLPAVSAPTADQPPVERNPPIPFSTLLRMLEDEDLYFPAELVSNYLLALQTKRFVILTGISGTGKTQLALAIAKAFRARVQVDATRRATEGAVEQQVLPYMVKYHRLTVPSTLRANLTLPALDLERNSGQIEVVYPAGRTSLRFYRDPDRPVVELLFSGEFRAWFDSELQVGDRFQLDVAPRDGDGADSLRFSLPVTETREELLDNYRVIAVRPDWTDNRGLLGYHNPLTEQYTTTTLLDLLLRAEAECQRAKREGGRQPYPFFAILDEMNLAHVEHYFSDFLSAMESGEEIDLHADAMLEAGEGAQGSPMPRRLKIPPNVFFTGTVNVDETTSMFSPKVLDRAFTIELDQVDLAGYGDIESQNDVLADDSPVSGLNLESFLGALEQWRKPDKRDWQAFAELSDGMLHRTVLELHGLLARSHRHFGYRVANEIARFVTLAAEQASAEPEALWAALDLAILEKVLPKFHGTQQELEEPLRLLFSFFITRKTGGRSVEASNEASWMLRGTQLVPAGVASAAAGIDVDSDAPVSTGSTPAFPRSAAKVWRMLERLRQQGFTSYIE